MPNLRLLTTPVDELLRFKSSGSYILPNADGSSVELISNYYSRFFVAVHNSSTLFMMAVDAMISIRRSESAVDRNVRDDDESK